MTPDQAREAIEELFRDEWDTRTPYTFENEKYQEPTPDVSWVRLSVRHFGGGQETLGPKTERIYRRVGQIVGQVFTPLIKGMRTGSVHAQELRAIFEGESFSGVDCTNGRVREIGPDGKHYQHNVEVDFFYDEKK